MPTEAAKRLGVRLRTLEKWRQDGFGPKFYKVGRVVRYSRAEIDRWLVDRIAESTTS